MTKEMASTSTSIAAELVSHAHHGRVHASVNGSGETTTGESTAYICFTARRPALLRAPREDRSAQSVSRAFSHYQLELRRRQETLSFEEAVDAEAERLAGEHEKIVADPRYYSPAHDRFSYLARGLYLDQIRRWQQHFSPSQLLILESGEFFHQTAEVFDRVLDFGCRAGAGPLRQPLPSSTRQDERRHLPPHGRPFAPTSDSTPISSADWDPVAAIRCAHSGS
jgi:hypothetical protein